MSDNKPQEQELQEPQEEHGIELDEELSPIVVPIKLYKFFMAHGKKGHEAMTVWLHLVYTARMQATNQVWANNEYLKKGTGYGEKKVRDLKTWLHRHNLIAYVQHQDKQTGLMGKTYIRVHGAKQLKTTGEAIPASADIHPTGYDDQMLKNSNKMLKDSKQAEPATAFSPQEEEEKSPPADNPTETETDTTQEQTAFNEAMEILNIYGIPQEPAREGAKMAIAAGITDFDSYIEYVKEVKAKYLEGKPNKNYKLAKALGDADKIEAFLEIQVKASDQDVGRKFSDDDDDLFPGLELDAEPPVPRESDEAAKYFNELKSAVNQ